LIKIVFRSATTLITALSLVSRKSIGLSPSIVIQCIHIASGV